MKRILCGPHAVAEALRARPQDIHLLLVDTSTKISRSFSTDARLKGVAIQTSTSEDLDFLSKGVKHQGVVAITGDYPYVDLDKLVNEAYRLTQVPLLLALDQVQDVQNVGSLVRSAVALGVHGLVLCRHGGAKLSPAAVRISAGASEHASVARVTNMSKCLNNLAKSGFFRVGLAAEADKSLHDLDLMGPTIFVLGSEGSGLRRLVRKSCDQLAHIPQAGPLGSLNVAVAGAIAMYEALRQRRNRK